MSDDLPTFSTGVETPSHCADEDWRGLFADLAAGRVSSLEMLYDASARQLYGLALWRTGSAEDAADVVQDVFVRLVEQGRRLARVKNPKAWLMTVTNRAAIDVIRRRRRRPTEPLDDHVFLTVADDDGEMYFDTVQVSAFLAGLPDTLRVVLYLKHFAGCTFAEIGNIVGVPKFTAASRYRSGIQKLRKLVEGEHETQ